jgi:hypothetical protein
MRRVATAERIAALIAPFKQEGSLSDEVPLLVSRLPRSESD